MKKLLKMLIIVCVFALFPLSVYADDTSDGYIAEFFKLVPEDMEDSLGDSENLIAAIGPRELFSEIFSAAIGSLGGAVSFFLLLLGCVALMGCASFGGGKLASVTECAVGVASSVFIFKRLGEIFLGVGKSLEELSDFFASLIPLLSAVTVAGGGGGAASVQHIGMNITLSLVGWIGSSFFYTVASVGFAFGLLVAIGDNGAASLTKGIKGFFTWTLGIATALLTATLSLQTAVAAASDGAAIRAAKYAASGMIPLVGGTVASALSTLASGLAYAKGVIGAGAIAVMVGIIASPLALLLLYRLVLSLALMLSDFLGVASSSRILGSFRGSFDFLIAVYALSSVLYIFNAVLFMKSGVAIL